MSEINSKEDMEVYLSSLMHILKELYNENISEDEKKIKLIKLAHEVMRDAASA
jgi:hypothetical protein